MAALPSPRIDRRAQLLKAAADLFGERGYATTSIDAIGARAGVTGPAVYRHFSGKRDLLLTLLTDAVDGGIAAMSASLSDDAPPLANLEELVRELVRHAIAERQLIGLLYAQTGALAPGDRQRVEMLRLRVVDLWAKTLGAARPDLSPDEVGLHVGAALSVIGGIAQRPPAKPGLEVEASYTRMLMGLLTA